MAAPKQDCTVTWTGPAGRLARGVPHRLHACELLAPHKGKKHACWCASKH